MPTSPPASMHFHPASGTFCPWHPWAGTHGLVTECIMIMGAPKVALIAGCQVARVPYPGGGAALESSIPRVPDDRRLSLFMASMGGSMASICGGPRTACRPSLNETARQDFRCGIGGIACHGCR